MSLATGLAVTTIVAVIALVSKVWSSDTIGENSFS